MEFVQRIYHKFARAALSMDSTDYAILVVCVLAISFACLRGFGSRTNY